MEWRFERRLVYGASARWEGWFCERCCWNRRKPASDLEQTLQSASIEQDFAAHSCEEFARAHWQATS